MANKSAAACAALALALAGGTAHGADYDPAHCAAVSGTLNIFWEALAGASAPCTGIEFTDGTLADTADGNFSMMGVSVSDPNCVGTGVYTFTLSVDKTTLTGADTLSNVPMTLVRGPGEACFVGHWVLGTDDYVATISALAAGDEIFRDGLE